MKILVTRPTDDAGPVSRALEERGATILAEPLLTIEQRPAALPDLDDAQALLFTSANGVRAFAAQSARRDLPVHAVGDATAEAARQAGFGEVDSAAGDVATLAEAVTARRKPEAGPLIQVAGTVSAGDLAGDLAKAGFRVDRVVLYEAVPAARLGDALTAALAAGEVAGALFFSPRTARLFLDLADEAGLRILLSSVTAYALSPAVAEILESGGFRRTLTAAAPTLPALLAAFDHDPPTAIAAEDTPAAAPEAAPAAVPDDGAPAPLAPSGLPAADFPPPEPSPARPVLDPQAVALPIPPRSASMPARSGKAAGWLGLLLLLVVGGVGTAPWWAPSILPMLPWGAPSPAAAGGDGATLAGRLAALEGSAGPLPAKLDALDRRVAALQSRLDQAPAAAPAQAAGPASAGDLSGGLDTLAARLGALERTAATMASLPGRLDAVDARLQPVEQRLGSVEQAGRADDPKLAALASRVDALTAQTTAIATQLDQLRKSETAARTNWAKETSAAVWIADAASIRTAIETGKPFSVALAVLSDQRRLAVPATADPAVDPALATLAPFASRGVDTVSQLLADFPNAAAAIRAASHDVPSASSEANWWTKARDAMGGVVQVTRTGPEAPGVEGVITRAGQALGRNDLPAAVAALRGLTGPAAAAAAPWMRRADSRLAALSAADTLTAALVRTGAMSGITLGAPTAPAPPPAAPAP